MRDGAGRDVGVEVRPAAAAGLERRGGGEHGRSFSASAAIASFGMYQICACETIWTEGSSVTSAKKELIGFLDSPTGWRT